MPPETAPPGGAASDIGSAPLSEAIASSNVHRSGQVVDHYRIVALLAEGGTARVYEAVHEFTKKPVALKIMRNRLTERRDVIERFRQEAVVLSSIKHANVVAVDNAGLTSDGRVFIAMELLRGKTLRQVLAQRGKLSIEETLRVLLEVAGGVSAAHEAGVTHRDLKPENIFCVSHGPVKVLDLGTAKFAGENAPSIQTAVGRIIGSVAYTAPERFNGDPADARSDIYALGLIAYECLAGYHAMVPDGRWPSATEIAARQVTYSPAAIEAIPAVLWEIIAKAIQKAPELRFQSVTELAQALWAANQPCRSSPQVQRRGEPQAARERSAVAAQSIGSGGLRMPIVAGLVFGVALSGAAQGFRMAHSSPASVTAREMGSAANAAAGEPVESSAAAESAVRQAHAEKTASSVTEPNATADSPAKGTSARIAAGARAAHAGPSRSTSPDGRTAENHPAAAEPAVGAAVQRSASASLSGAYESFPAVPAPKDDLPASGL
jgi:serine/threonine-protein kinase